MHVCFYTHNIPLFLLLTAKVRVYNTRGRQEELLGSAEVSVSSVLGGGHSNAQWVTLTYSLDPGDGSPAVEVKAGEIQVCILTFLLIFSCAPRTCWFLLLLLAVFAAVVDILMKFHDHDCFG